jgi:hypothetical protein
MHRLIQGDSDFRGSTNLRKVYIDGNTADSFLDIHSLINYSLAIQQVDCPHTLSCIVKSHSHAVIL